MDEYNIYFKDQILNKQPLKTVDLNKPYRIGMEFYKRIKTKYYFRNSRMKIVIENPTFKNNVVLKYGQFIDINYFAL